MFHEARHFGSLAIPDGASPEDPVITPGASDFSSNRIHRDGANVGTNQSP
jgi:hypothetical protein